MNAAHPPCWTLTRSERIALASAHPDRLLRLWEFSERLSNQMLYGCRNERSHHAPQLAATTDHCAIVWSFSRRFTVCHDAGDGE